MNANGIWRARKVRWIIASLAAIAAIVTLSGAIPAPTGAASGTALSGPPPRPTTAPSFRIAAFNIHSGFDVPDRSLQPIATALAGFDIIGLNEIRRGQREDQAMTLGRHLTMPHLFAPSERRWWRDSFGNGLLCAFPVTHWQRIPLPGSGARGRRNVVLMHVTIDGTGLSLLLTHLDRGRDREAQARKVFELFVDLPEPAVLMGDLNVEPHEELMRRLLGSPSVTDAHNRIENLPPNRVDWILTRGLRVRDAGMTQTGLSDHPLLWADLEIPR